MKRTFKLLLLIAIIFCTIFGTFACDNSDSDNVYKNDDVSQYLSIYGSCTKSGVSYTPWATTYDSAAKITVSVSSTHDIIVFKNVVVKIKINFYPNAKYRKEDDWNSDNR